MYAQKEMKRYFYLLLLMMAMPALLTSCLKDNDDVVLTDYCYISGFSLGKLKKTNFTKGYDGQDSSYLTTMDGSYFPMAINQRTLTIENPDSMPVGTRVDKVLTSIDFKGVLAWRKTVMENPEDSIWVTYSSSDTLDFTHPIEFACYAQDGSSYRKYTVKLNVHEQTGDTTVWNRLDVDAAKSALQGLGERKVVAWKNALWVFGAQAYATRALSPAGNWATGRLTTVGEIDVQTIQKMGGRLYASNTDGMVLMSEDGVYWCHMDGVLLPNGYQLVAAGKQMLYALHEGNLYSTQNDGITWKQETLDADPAHLPTKCVQSCMLTQSNGTQRLMLLGNGKQNTEVWSKAWTDNEADAQWMYYNVNTVDKHRLPQMPMLNVLPYDKGMVALGGPTTRAGVAHSALDSLFYSEDFGITWKAEDDKKIDPELTKVAANAQQITATVDDEQFIWVVVDDEVWRGRTNRLGFLRKDK